jgi:hypothetical protein
MEYVVHKMLEGCRSIGESEGHDQEFKGTISSPERCFPFLTFRYPDVVVSFSEVEFGEEFGTSESIQ